MLAKATEDPGFNTALVQMVVAVFGAGGLVSLVKAILDWKNGKAQKETDLGERYMSRLDKRITYLEKERERDALYIADLIQSLARAGVIVPDRRR